jgi:hypothetical protein
LSANYLRTTSAAVLLLVVAIVAWRVSGALVQLLDDYHAHLTLLNARPAARVIPELPKLKAMTCRP